jgi:hypothetical protein
MKRKNQNHRRFVTLVMFAVALVAVLLAVLVAEKKMMTHLLSVATCS